MNPIDYAGILTNTGKTLWKHKIISGFFLIVFCGPSLIIVVGMAMFIFSTNLNDPEQILSIMNDGPALTGIIIIYILLGIVSLLSIIVSYAAVLKGTSLATTNPENITLGTLWQSSKDYFWRIAGLLILSGILIFAIILPAFILSTFFFPLMCIIFPILMFGQFAVQLLLATIVHDDLGVQDALKQTWQFIKKYFSPFILISIILLVIEFGASMILTTPLSMIQGVMMQGFVLNSPESGMPEFSSFFKMIFLSSLFFMPFILVIQGLVRVYSLSAIMQFYISIKARNGPDMPTE